MKNQRNFFQSRVITIMLLFLIICSGAINFGCYQFMCLPEQSIISESGELPLPAGIFGVYAEKRTNDIPDAITAAAEQGANMQENIDIKILNGLMTIKTISVQKQEDIYVIPGGHAIGILLQTDGVTVVGFSPVIDANGKAVYPAKDCGLQNGDFITHINGEQIRFDIDIEKHIQLCGEQGRNAEVRFIRDKQEYNISVAPQYCNDTKSWRIGLYVRDNTAGIGTLTYFNPQNLKYGALGHEISDPDEKTTKDEEKGSIIRATIDGIKIGTAGDPGEKLGAFVSDTWRGTIETNCSCGIFGRLESGLRNPLSNALPIAYADEVQTGPAQIYTVIDGENIECFEIEIIKLLPNYKISGKGMVIEVTDANLLSRTGGIVQGMSGSPIIQNGKLIGAVTHVFVNDPKRGYGIFIENMLEAAE